MQIIRMISYSKTSYKESYRNIGWGWWHEVMISKWHEYKNMHVNMFLNELQLEILTYCS